MTTQAITTLLYGNLDMIRAMLYYYCGSRKSLSPQALGNLRRFGRIVNPKELRNAWRECLHAHRIRLTDITHYKRKADRYWPNYLEGSDY